jgi:hypothetical protein
LAICDGIASMVHGGGWNISASRSSARAIAAAARAIASRPVAAWSEASSVMC